MIDAWQRGVIARRIFLSFNGARLRIDAEVVTFAMLYRNVLSIFLVALRQLGAHTRLTTQFTFDVFETSAAIGSRLSGTATRALYFRARGRIDAPGVTGRGVILLSLIISINSAFGRVKAGGDFSTTSFHDFGVTRALLGQSGVHHKSDHMGGSAAGDFTLLTRSRTAVRDLFAGVTIDAPAVAGRTVTLGSIE